MELWIDVARVKEISQFPRPLSLRFDVARQEVLVWRRGQRERMVLRRLQGGTVQTHPLAGQVFKVRRTIELHLQHVRRQKFGLQYIQSHILGSQAHHLVQNEYDSGSDEVFPEFRRPGDSGQPMQQHQHVHGHVQTMRGPKVRVRLFPDNRVREREDGYHYHEQSHSGDS